jgi:hypothetical protein
LKREADGAYSAVEDLRAGPIAMPKDSEWVHFIENDDHFVDPSIPVREAQYIQYPGKDNALAQEVRAGLMERKSKYLKSYTAGWYSRPFFSFLSPFVVYLWSLFSFGTGADQINSCSPSLTDAAL